MIQWMRDGLTVFPGVADAVDSSAIIVNLVTENMSCSMLAMFLQCARYEAVCRNFIFWCVPNHSTSDYWEMNTWKSYTACWDTTCNFPLVEMRFESRISHLKFHTVDYCVISYLMWQLQKGGKGGASQSVHFVGSTGVEGNNVVLVPLRLSPSAPSPAAVLEPRLSGSPAPSWALGVPACLSLDTADLRISVVNHC